jgi:hypothetical protein
MVGGLFEGMGVEKTDLNTHKTIVAFLSGGLLPIISLTFAHMLVKFSEQTPEEQKVLSEDEFKEILKERRENSETEKWTPTDEQLEILEKMLDGKYRGPENEKIIEEPINPTKEELDELEKLFGKILEDKYEVFEKKTDYNPYGEDGTEFYNEPLENSEITETSQENEVEKKNNSDELHTEQETRWDEDYKVLNYLSRDAQN